MNKNLTNILEEQKSSTPPAAAVAVDPKQQVVNELSVSGWPNTLILKYVTTEKEKEAIVTITKEELDKLVDIYQEYPTEFDNLTRNALTQITGPAYMTPYERERLLEFRHYMLNKYNSVITKDGLNFDRPDVKEYNFNIVKMLYYRLHNNPPVTNAAAYLFPTDKTVNSAYGIMGKDMDDLKKTLIYKNKLSKIKAAKGGSRRVKTRKHKKSRKAQTTRKY